MKRAKEEEEMMYGGAVLMAPQRILSPLSLVLNKSLNVDFSPLKGLKLMYLESQ